MMARLFIVLIFFAAIFLIAIGVRALLFPKRQVVVVRQGSSDGWASTPFWRWVARLAALGAIIAISIQLATRFEWL